MKSLTCIVRMMTNDFGQQKLKSHMLLYPAGQMLDCFTNVNVTYIMLLFNYMDTFPKLY